MDRPKAAILLQFLVCLSVCYCWYTRNFDCVCRLSLFSLVVCGLCGFFWATLFSLFWTLILFCLITWTSPCNEDLVNATLYTGKWVYLGIYYFSYFCSKNRLWVLVRAPTIYVLIRNKKNISKYHLKKKRFWSHKILPFYPNESFG